MGGFQAGMQQIQDKLTEFSYLEMASIESTPKRVQWSYTVSDKLEAI